MKKFYLILITLFLFFGFINISVAQRVKFFESFDSVNVESKGWKFINNDKGIQEFPLFYQNLVVTDLGEILPLDGNYMLKYNSLNANESGIIDEWIILPKMTNVEKYDTLSFYCGAVDRNYKDSLRVLISVSNEDLSSFVEIDKFKIDGPVGNWNKKSYSLSEYAGKQIYIALNYYIFNGGAFGPSSDFIWIDRFSITNPYGEGIPVKDFSLSQNFPNPFNPRTDITFSIPNNTKVTLKVYDISGKEVMTLVNGEYSPGKYLVTFNGTNLASGVYLYEIIAGNFKQTNKMLLVK
ncbi:MAG TPA: choice-of-anchor J domain-containing protein [Ignavibacteria bacterium]|nr:choice-of-anchor J domain-containing protein [Ignavibacteria bacterium]